jgi:hypothetical protein
MTYAAAQAWVSNLTVVNSDIGAHIDDWRLPDILDLSRSACGPSNCGPNDSPTIGHSEVFNLLYGRLGNSVGALITKSGPFGQIPGSIGQPNNFVWLGSLYEFPGAAASSSILTVEGHLVWEPSNDWPPILAWATLPAEGIEGPAVVSLSILAGQQPNVYAMEGIAWAVRTGDVSTVPLPGAAMLFMIGISVLAKKMRRRNSDSPDFER